MTGVNVKRFCHDGAKEFLTKDLKAWYQDKGITSETTELYKAQQNGKAERVNRTLMERMRAALLDAGAEEELWTEALTSVVHVLNRSPKAGLDATPLEALTGRRPNVSGFCVWGSCAWVLKPKTQQRKDGPNKVFERRDVLMEEKPAKAGTLADGSTAGPQLKMTDDSGNNEGVYGSVNMLEAEGDVEEKRLSVQKSESDDYGDPDGLADDNDDEKSQGQTDSLLPVGNSPSEVSNAAPGLRSSTSRPAPEVTWWEKNPQADQASGAESAAKDGCDLTKPPAIEKEAHARPDWKLCNQAIIDDMAAHKNLDTLSTIKCSNKHHKAVKTRFVLDIKHDAEGKKTRYKSRLVAQGFHQVPGRYIDETWAPVPNTATSRALFAVAAANGW